MVIPLLLFCIGLLLLVKGADYFVEGGGGLAARFGVSPTTIGFTVIAFGTSLPEFVVSINAAASGNPEIALGNILGSNIANIALVLALCAAIKPRVICTCCVSPSPAKPGVIMHEISLMLIATAVFVLVAARGVIDIYAAVVLLVAFLFIIRFLLKNNRVDKEEITTHGKMDYLYTLGGLISVAIGSQLVLEGAVEIAEMFGIPSFVIGLSMVAVGTSLPELATSVVAIIKGSGGISVGNLLGSNIFNLLFVLGCGGLVAPIPIPGLNDVFIVGLFSLAVIPLFMGKELLTRVWALCLLGGYAVYMALLFGIF
jgi:cation:H+ antiporter